MYGFTLAISCCVKTSNIPSKFVKYIDVPLFKAVTLAVVKTDAKNVLLNSLFSRTECPAFFIYDLCHICLLSANWVLFLKKKPAHRILSVYA